MSILNSSLKKGHWASSYKTYYYPIPKQDPIKNIDINFVTFIIQQGAGDGRLWQDCPDMETHLDPTQYGNGQKIGTEHSRGETFIDWEHIYSQQSYILGVSSEGHFLFQ